MQQWHRMHSIYFIKLSAFFKLSDQDLNTMYWAFCYRVQVTNTESESESLYMVTRVQVRVTKKCTITSS